MKPNPLNEIEKAWREANPDNYRCCYYNICIYKGPREQCLRKPENCHLNVREEPARLERSADVE